MTTPPRRPLCIAPLALCLLSPQALGQGQVYWVGNGFGPDDVRRASLDGPNSEIVASGRSFPQDLAVDRTGNKVYWADFGLVRRANLDGSSVEDLVTTGLNVPAHIALDVAAGKMYWTDTNDQQLKRANFDGSNIEDLHSNDHWGLALDLVNRKLYWGFATVIWCSELDGTNPSVVLNTGAQLRGMAIDAEAGQLYSAALNPSGIRRLDLAKLHIQAISIGSDTPFGVDLDLAPCAPPLRYCFAGVSASACQAEISVQGIPSASAATGFKLEASASRERRTACSSSGPAGVRSCPGAAGAASCASSRPSPARACCRARALPACAMAPSARTSTRAGPRSRRRTPERA